MNKQLLGGVAVVALGAAFLGVGAAEAQTSLGAQVTQSAYKADAANFAVSMTYTNCTAAGATVANSTLTITPPAGNYVYLTGFYVEGGLSNSTGALSAQAWSSTNLNGSPAWLASMPAPGATANVPMSQQLIAESYPTAFKSTTPGSAVTLTPTASLASAYVCAKAIGFFNPN